MSTVAGLPAQHAAQAVVISRGQTRLQRAWRLVRQQPLGAVSALVIGVLIIFAVFAPFIAPHDPLAINPREALQSPRWGHLMGTDAVGRDVFSRIVYGSRLSLYVGIIAVGLGTVVGSAIGLVSGYFGGKADMVLQRTMDSVMALPPLVLALAVVSVLGRSSTNGLFAISIIIIPFAARVVRGSVLSVKEEVYIDAARAIGGSDRRILLRHILPNVMAPIIVIASVTLGGAILIEASLSFLGLGTPPPNPSWGAMLSGEGRSQLERAPWLAIFPVAAISLTILSFNLLGDSVRDILDPRLRGTQ